MLGSLSSSEAIVDVFGAKCEPLQCSALCLFSQTALCSFTTQQKDCFNEGRIKGSVQLALPNNEIRHGVEVVVLKLETTSGGILGQ